MAQVTSRIRRKYSNLKSLVGNTITEIDENMLKGITKIRSSMFYGCTSLSSVKLPTSVTQIADGAFLNCTNLSNVIIEAVTPPTIGDNVFRNTHSSLVIQVPSESVNTYKSATGWSTYSDKIQAIPSE